jgi:Glycosyl transferase 4-like domain
MRRVLLLGLYYPPANFMAGRRLEGWARHLNSFGYEPLVLTRYYDPDERNSHDVYASSRPTRTLTQPWIEGDRVVYTRFKQQLWTRAPLPGKIRGLGHYAWPDPDHSGWLRECRQYVAHAGYHPDVIIGSHGPAGVLRVARKLAEWLNVPWLADFRDLWVREEWTGLDKRQKMFFQRQHLRSAAGITVATEGMADAIRAQIAPLTKIIKPIYNGAEPVQNISPHPEDQDALETYRAIASRYQIVLTYTGHLYPGQRVERFLDTVSEFNDKSGKSCAVVLCGAHDRAEYKNWPFVHLLGPVRHTTALFLQKESAALFYPTWPATDSVYSGKIFEMALSGRPVFVSFTPSRDLEALCGRMKSTIVTKEPEELLKRLDALTEMDAHDAHNGKPPAIATKKYWAGQLVECLGEILDNERRNRIK